MKSVLFIILITISTPLFSSQIVPATYTTVTESECNSEIHLFKNGKGEFIDSCKNEIGLSFGKVYKNTISWSLKNDDLLVKINGILETFTYQKNISCVYFGEKGASEGVAGFGMYFLRMPVKCK